MKGMSVSLFKGLSRTVKTIIEQAFLMLSRGTSQCHLWSWHLQSFNSTTEPQLRISCYLIIQILHNGWFGLSNASIKMLVLIKTCAHVIFLEQLYTNSEQLNQFLEFRLLCNLPRGRIMCFHSLPQKISVTIGLPSRNCVQAI